MTVSTKLMVGGLALLSAFLLGYAPASITARADRAERDRLAHALAVADLQIQLGMMSYEANRDNFGLAGQLATVFFDGVRSESAGAIDQNVVTSLQAILARRDEITTDLAQANPGVKSKLAELYADLYRLPKEPRVARPVSP